MTQQTQQIVGVFLDSAAASRAVDELVEAHFAPRRDISVINVSPGAANEEVPILHKTRVPIGLAIGLGIGLLVGGVVGAVLLGRTDALDAGGGIVRVVLFAGGLGALVGVLWGLTYWRDRPDFEHHQGDGKTSIQVSVNATDLRGRADEARTIFRRAGAVEVQ